VTRHAALVAFQIDDLDLGATGACLRGNPANASIRRKSSAAKRLPNERDWQKSHGTLPKNRRRSGVRCTPLGARRADAISPGAPLRRTCPRPAGRMYMVPSGGRLADAPLVNRVRSEGSSPNDFGGGRFVVSSLRFRQSRPRIAKGAFQETPTRDPDAMAATENRSPRLELPRSRPQIPAAELRRPDRPGADVQTLTNAFRLNGSRQPTC